MATHTIPYVLIISGPTASGKTKLSQSVGQLFDSEIINADVGQFYTRLSIGTAKPDLKQAVVPHHLFDIIDKPCDLSVLEYRKKVIDQVNAIWAHGKIPLIVGGSLFYIKSLFFPPFDYDSAVQEGPADNDDLEGLSAQQVWDKLNKIDPIRAQELHVHDEYRVRRALAIWKQTKQKPSSLKPVYNPPFHFRFVFIAPSPSALDEVILIRIREMINLGWLEEARQLIGTEWEPFLRKKNLIGYPEIIEWLNNGSKKEELEELIKTIYFQTRQYAKRQKLFWKSFSAQLQLAASGSSLMHHIDQLSDFPDEQSCKKLEKNIRDDLTSLKL
jgi:tRNA dimethylallyltransferase